MPKTTYQHSSCTLILLRLQVLDIVWSGFLLRNDDATSKHFQGQQFLPWNLSQVLVLCLELVWLRMHWIVLLLIFWFLEIFSFWFWVIIIFWVQLFYEPILPSQIFPQVFWAFFDNFSSGSYSTPYHPIYPWFTRFWLKVHLILHQNQSYLWVWALLFSEEDGIKLLPTLPLMHQQGQDCTFIGTISIGLDKVLCWQVDLCQQFVWFTHLSNTIAHFQVSSLYGWPYRFYWENQDP